MAPDASVRLPLTVPKYPWASRREGKASAMAKRTVANRTRRQSFLDVDEDVHNRDSLCVKKANRERTWLVRCMTDLLG
jgi:hypothetical protein